MFILVIPFDRVQFTLIRGANIPGSSAILSFTAADFTVATRHIPSWALLPLWPSHLILSGIIALHSSPVAYWTHFDLGAHLTVSYLFTFSYCSWGSHDKNTGVLWHSLLQWTTFCQNSSLWHIWVAPHSIMAHNFIDLCKAFGHNKAVIHEEGNNLYPLSGYKSWFCHLLATWPWANYLACLCLSFHI